MPIIKIEPILPEDRNNDGTLTDAGREKAFKQIEIYLKGKARLNYSDLKARLGVSYHTARGLVEEVVKRWREEEKDNILIEIKWHENMFNRLETEPPEVFGLKTDIEKYHKQQEILENIQKLRTILPEISGTPADDPNAIYFHVFGRLPRPIKESTRKVILDDPSLYGPDSTAGGNTPVSGN